MDKLADMGVVLQPAEASSSKIRKGKGKARPSGHVVFAESRSDCEQSKCYVMSADFRQLKLVQAAPMRSQSRKKLILGHTNWWIWDGSRMESAPNEQLSRHWRRPTPRTTLELIVSPYSHPYPPTSPASNSYDRPKPSWPVPNH